MPKGQIIFHEDAKNLSTANEEEEKHYVKKRKTPISEMAKYQDRIFIVISGHASLHVEEKDDNLKYITRTLFPGDAVGDGPLVQVMKKGQIFSLISESECDIISIDKEVFKSILIDDFTHIGDLKDKME